MLEEIKKSFIVPREYHHQRIDVVLAELLPEYSRSQLSQWIKAGAITLNQVQCKPKDKVVDGDNIELNIAFKPEDKHYQHCEPENIPLNVIYEDDDLMVINKPAGLVVHPGAGNKQHTLVNALIHYCPALQHIPRAGIIHRLDKDTTGLLIIAKSLPAHTSLVRQMHDREIERHYLALVTGYLVGGGTIETYFGRHPRNRLKMAVLEQGREAVTHYTIKQKFQDFTLLDVHLMTGRTHQIRVHMAHINHPVVGDQLYGGRMKIPQQASNEFRTHLQQFKRQALHAYSLTFYHPINEKLLTLEAPIPDDFSLLLNVIEQYDHN